MERARRGMDRVPLRNGTLQHPVHAKHGAARVMLAPAAEGTGVIAGGPMRAIFDVMGVRNVVAKSHGSTNPYNMVRATLKALQELRTPAEIAAKRGKTVEDIAGDGK
jgi:small subunit ribosomal protein S5